MGTKAQHGEVLPLRGVDYSSPWRCYKAMVLSTTPPGEMILIEFIRLSAPSINNAFYKAVRELNP